MMYRMKTFTEIFFSQSQHHKGQGLPVLTIEFFQHIICLSLCGSLSIQLNSLPKFTLPTVQSRIYNRKLIF